MQLGRTMIAALLVVLVLSPEQIAAQEQRAAYLIEILDNETWVMLPNGATVEQEASSRISDAAFELSIFGGLSNATITAKAKLERRLGIVVDDMAVKEKLTFVQKQKLYLAGRGDIQRFFDRVEESRIRFQSPVIRDQQGIHELRQEFYRESEWLRAEYMKPFKTGSLFAKTLNSVRRG